jgi:hypothetical protein
MALFQQLFALQEAILELREQLEYCPSSSESSPYDSPCSTLSSLSSSESGSKCTKVRTQTMCYNDKNCGFVECGVVFNNKISLNLYSL